MQIIKRYLCVVLAAAFMLVGCSAGQKPMQAFEAQYFEFFDTVSMVTIYAENQEKAEEYLAIVESELKKYHQLFDIYHSYDGRNNVKTINDNAGIAPVEVEPELLGLLEFAREQYEATNGRVNVAMGSVLSIWHTYREDAKTNPGHAQVPDAFQLEKAAKHTDINQMILDKNASTVYLADQNMSLDVGAIAKGYASQRLTDTLREAGVSSALISLGGNVQTIGKKAKETAWKVGVQNPQQNASSSYLHALDLEDMALVTSGTYQRFYEVDGVRYHHIINPDTLMPENTYASVTIVCADSGKADAWSTAVFNMEPEEGMAWIEAQEAEALWVLPDGTEIESSGFGAYIDQQLH